MSIETVTVPHVIILASAKNGRKFAARVKTISEDFASMTVKFEDMQSALQLLKALVEEYEEAGEEAGSTS